MNAEDDIRIPLPVENPELLGQDAAEASFLKAWNSGRLAHAWLLTGPRGVGKATLAYRIARHVLSQGGNQAGGLFGEPLASDSLQMAPEHDVFRRIAAGAHGDLKVVARGYSDDKQTKRRNDIVVDDVRGIGPFMAMTAAEGGWRVVIVDAADEMNRNAANALLKVLEEPPGKALLLLLAHNPGRLLPTIRSRCRTLPVRPLPDDLLDGLLNRYRPDLSAQDRAALIQISDGSIGRAITMIEDGGLELYQDLVGVLTSLPRLDIPAAHALGEKVARSSDTLRLAGELLTWWLGRLVLSGARGQLPPEVIAGEGAVSARLLGASSLDQWREVWEKITHMFAKAQSVNLDGKQVVVNALMLIQKQAGAL